MPASKHLARIVPAIATVAFCLFTIPTGSNAQTSGDVPLASGSLLALGERLGIQKVAIDSSGNAEAQSADTSQVKQHKSALAAVLFSIIPGGGQIYNGSYWKVPIVWGVQGYFVYEWIANNKVYRSYEQELADSIAVGPSYQSSSYSRQENINTLIGLRNAAQDQRDSYAWYIAGTYLLSMLDAYVDAELSGFNVSPNLSSTPVGKVFALNFRMKF